MSKLQSTFKTVKDITKFNATRSITHSIIQEKIKERNKYVESANTTYSRMCVATLIIGIILTGNFTGGLLIFPVSSIMDHHYDSKIKKYDNVINKLCDLHTKE